MDSRVPIDRLFGKADERDPLSKGDNGGKNDPGWLPFSVQAQDGVMLVCKIFQQDQDKEGKPDVLFFPSERDTKDDILDMAAGLSKFGITLMAVDFRGQGESGGGLSIDALPLDAEAIYKRDNKVAFRQVKNRPFRNYGKIPWRRCSPWACRSTPRGCILPAS